MFEDFKQNVADKQERLLEQHFLKNIKPLSASQQPTSKGKDHTLKQFQYSGPEALIKQLMFIHPDLTHLVITDLDNRDVNGVPSVSTQTLRKRFTELTYSMGKEVLNRVNYEVFVIAVCIIENNVVYYKIMKSEYDPTHRGLFC